MYYLTLYYCSTTATAMSLPTAIDNYIYTAGIG